MSVIMRQRARRSYLADLKHPSSFEKHSNTPKIQVETTCPICQEPVGTRNPDGVTEFWSLLPCGHQFGSHCIKHYLRLVADDRPSCPICRQTTYHICGHPFVPVVLAPGHEPRQPNPHSDTMLRGMQATYCGYCHDRRTARPQRRGMVWKAGSWLLTLATQPRRLLARNRRRDPGALRGSLLVPWEEEDNGPWIDAFPRSRDPGWERWWDKQEPKERNPAVGPR